jgi:hypothetical protein
MILSLATQLFCGWLIVHYFWALFLYIPFLLVLLVFHSSSWLSFFRIHSAKGLAFFSGYRRSFVIDQILETILNLICNQLSYVIYFATIDTTSSSLTR